MPPLDDNPRLKRFVESQVAAEKQRKNTPVKPMKASDFDDRRPSTDLHEDPLILNRLKLKGGNPPTRDLPK